MAGLDPRMALGMLYGGFGVVLAGATLARRSARARPLYGVVSLAFFAVALAAVVSAISLYVYEHPHHHCPFCLLKREYSYFGFLLYAPLFAGAALGASAGALGLVRTPASLAHAMPAILRRMVVLSALGFAGFVLVATWAIARSGLILTG